MLTPDKLRTPIETRRLILRCPARSDITAICRLINDPEIALNTGTIHYPYPPISAWRWLAHMGKEKSGRFHMAYLLTLRSNPRMFAGVAGIRVHPHRAPSIGYWLGRAYRGRGYASEAARALIAFIFLHSNESAVTATARVSNPASQRVLKAAGMRRVGYGSIKSAQLNHYVPVLKYRIERGSDDVRYRKWLMGDENPASHS